MASLIYSIFMAVLMLASVAGWVTNVVWTFSQTDAVNLVLGIVGIFVPFIGAAHGVWLWF